MIVKRRITIKPEEIIGVQYTCKRCGVQHSIPLARSPFVVFCPSCNQQWILKEYAIDSSEPYNSTVSGFNAMLKKLPQVIISESVDFALEIDASVESNIVKTLS
ncbi:MAG TPA: hypothetical protein VG273_20960 [Bryobacteraceae bacterium]|jgi:hypothetical protein|nr:hypothetical protein [Bryobacteraceae bacterium]